MSINLTNRKYLPSMVCYSCEKTLNHFNEFYNRGICPHCGANSDSTIVDAKIIPLKWVKSWWIFGHWENPDSNINK